MDVPAGTAHGGGLPYLVYPTTGSWCSFTLPSHTRHKCSHCGKQNPVQLLLSFGLAARTSKWWAEKRITFQDRKPEVNTCLAASSLGAEGVQAMMEMGKPCLA